MPEKKPQGESIENISAKQLLKNFQANIFSMFYLVKEALPHLQKGAAIINTTTVTAYKGSRYLLDYLFLACEDSSYMTGQVLHPNGGEIING